MSEVNNENPSNPVKSPLLSKTIIANIVVFLIAVLGVLDTEVFNIDPNYVLQIVAVLNIILRFVTSEKITLDALLGGNK